MKLGSFALGFGLLIVGASVSACSITATPGPGGGASDPGTAVKSQPLAGTINGKPFTAKVAIARPGFSGSGKQVDVYDVDATCDQQPALASGDHQILLDVANWADGTAYQLDTSHSLTFVEEPANNFVTFTGRVEVTKTGTADAPGTIALRANDADKGSVEGQVQVLNCAQ
jgi:hypothetical protein